MDDWQIERLDRTHERAAFRCGRPALDEFLRSLVSQYEKRRLGRTYVAVRPGDRRAYGYYTLASSSIPFEHLPAAVSRKLPRHPVPLALLARLAVDEAVRGQGLGAELLMDALRRCLDLSGHLGIFAVEVVAIDTEARAFYQKYGFVPLLDNELHLFLPMKTIADGFGTADAKE